MKKDFKIAFVCDWLTGMRGGERCLEAACEVYPAADIFTLVHIPGSVSPVIESHKIKTSYIQDLPAAPQKFRSYLPLFPHAIYKFELSDYDIVLSFSHCVAKGVFVQPTSPHICYCCTPMRYAWDMKEQYLSSMSWLKRQVAALALSLLKQWDKRSSERVTSFIAVSKNVQVRIKTAYNRNSTVIYPPVDCSRFSVCSDNEGYYLIVSALVPYKRVDLAVNAFNSFKRRLLIVGNGHELTRLKRLACSGISFVENATDNEVVEYMKKCRALIFPGDEDFGIVPLEAQACGKPVIAFGKGGSLETVIASAKDDPSKKATGIFFYSQTPDALRQAVLEFEKNPDSFDPQVCRRNAFKFDRPVFKSNLQNYIEKFIDR